MTTCLNCSQHTENPKFCSRSCSTSYSNRMSPKRTLTRKCRLCEAVVRNYRSALCETHYVEAKETKYLTTTVGEYRDRLSVKGKHKSWANSHIRNFARSWNKSLRKQPCRKCGYTLHVELAHIRPVSDFPDEALLTEINAESNMIPLCPNCHWEFDNLPRDNFFALRM